MGVVYLSPDAPFFKVYRNIPKLFIRIVSKIYLAKTRIPIVDNYKTTILECDTKEHNMFILLTQSKNFCKTDNF